MKTLLALLLIVLAWPVNAREPIWYWNFKIADGSGIGFTDNDMLRDCMKALLPVKLRHGAGTQIIRNANGFAVVGTGPEALKHARDIWIRKEPEKLVLPAGTELSVVIRGFSDRVEIKSLTRDYEVFTLNYTVSQDTSAWSDGQNLEHYPWASIAIIPVGKLTIGSYDVDIAPSDDLCGPFVFEVK